MADVKEHIFGDVYADSINGPVLSCTSGDPFAPHTYASLVWDVGTSSFQVRTGDTTNPLIHPPISFLYRVESLYVPTQPTDLVRKNELDSMAMGATWQKAVNEICDEATITPPLTIGKRYIALTTAGTWIKDHIYECLTVAPNTWRDDVPAPGWACLILDGTKWPDQTVIFVDATPGPSTWTPMGISLSHLDLTNIGTYTHAQIDSHINTIAGSDPHSGQDLHTTASPTFTGATFAKISPGPVLTFNNTSVTPSSLTMSLADSGSFDINASLGPIAFSATSPLIIYNTAEASYTAGLPPIITGSIITYGGIYSALRVYATNMTCTTAPVAGTDVVRLVDIISGGIDVIPASFTYLGVGRLAAGPPVVPGTNPNPPPAAPVPLVVKSVAGDGVLYQLGLIDSADRYCQIRSLEGTGDMTFLPFTDRDYIFDYNGTTTTGRILAKCSLNPGNMTATNCGVVIGTSATATGSLGVGGLCCEKFKICDTNHSNPTSGFILSASASGHSGLAMLQFTNKGYVRPTYNPVFDMGDDMRINIPGSPAGSSFFSSTTPATGALTVLGGVGIRENLNIGNGATNSVLAFWKSGVSADKIAMSYSVGSPNDLTWTPNYTGARYVLGYSTSGGELIVQSPTNASATPTGAIQTSGGIYAARDEYIAGTTTTGGQLSSAVFIATYSNSLFANVAALITPTLSGAPVITGGKLDLTGYAARYVQYDAATNLAALNDLVTIRFLYTPNYGPAAPAQRQYMFSTSDGTVLNKNMIQIYHETNNTLWIRIYSAGSVALVNQSFGVQNAFTAGTEYEICLCFEGDSPPPPTGNTRLFINGVQFGPSVQSRAGHTGVLTSMFIGKDSNVPSAAGNPNFYMRALSIYPAVLYTANYAAGTYSAVGETVYGAENVGSLRVTGLSYLANTTDATDLNTGALIDMGGASIAKNLHVGGVISIHGSNPATIDNTAGQLIFTPGATTKGYTFDRYADLTGGDIIIASTTDATTAPIAGSIVTAGGLYVAKKLFAMQTPTTANEVARFGDFTSGTFTPNFSRLGVNGAADTNIPLKVYANGTYAQMQVYNSTFTGNFFERAAGGLNIWSSSGALRLNADVTDAATGAVIIPNGTASADPSTGALTIGNTTTHTGGLGVAQNCSIGAEMRLFDITTPFTAYTRAWHNGTTTYWDCSAASRTFDFNANFSQVKINGVTAASSKTVAALIVTGGIATSGKVYADTFTAETNGTTGQHLTMIDTSAGPTTATIRNNAAIMEFAVPLTVAGKGYSFAGDADAGIVTVNCSVAATDATDGAFHVAGGASVGGDFHTGGKVYIHGSPPVIIGNDAAGQMTFTPGAIGKGYTFNTFPADPTGGVVGVASNLEAGAGPVGSIVTAGGIWAAKNVLAGGLGIGASAPVITMFDTDTALTASSNTRLATQLAVKTYVDNAVSGGITTVLSLNGFQDRTSTTISFTDVGLLFTIALQAPATQFVFYSNDIRFTKLATETKTITAASGMHYIYYDGAGVLQETTVWSDDFILKYCAVATVYWNNDMAPAQSIYLGDERHGYEMEPSTHYNLHNSVGTVYLFGLTPASYVTPFVPGDGSLNSHAQLTITTGDILDEDIRHTIPAKSALTTPIKVFYLQTTGGSTTWWQGTTTGAFFYTAGSIQYNSNVGGVWGLTPVVDTQYVLGHVVATNSREFVVFLGQQNYGNIAAARANASTELERMYLVGFPFAEFCFIATFIYRRNTAFANAFDTRLEAVDGANSLFIDWRQQTLNASASTPTAHASLTGLTTGDDHTQYFKVLGRPGEALTVQNADGTPKGATLSVALTTGEMTFSHYSTAGYTFTGDATTGIVTIVGSLDSDSTTGALIVAGGAKIAKNASILAQLRLYDTTPSTAYSYLYRTGANTYFDSSAASQVLYFTTNFSQVRVNGTTNATDVTSGAFHVEGGASIVQDLHVGGTVQIHGSDPAIIDNNAGQLIFKPGTVSTGFTFDQFSIAGGGDVLINSTTNCTSVTSGALQVRGGVRIGRAATFGYSSGGLSDVLFLATFENTTNADVNAIVSGTIIGDVKITGSKLDLTGYVDKQITFDTTTSLASLMQTGTIRFLLTPAYTGSPINSQVFITALNQAGGSHIVFDNWFDGANGMISLYMSDVNGADLNYVETIWSCTAGQEYDICICFDCAGTTRLFIDGVAIITMPTIGVRGTSDRIKLGSSWSNIYIRNLIIYPTVLFTANFAPEPYDTYSSKAYAVAKFDSLSTNQIAINNTVDSSRVGDGSAIFAGGISVAKNMHIGGVLAIHGSDPVIFDNNAGQMVITAGKIGSGFTFNPYSGDTTGGSLAVTASVQSTNTSTGAIIIPNGGIGLGGNLNVGQTSTIGTFSTFDQTYNNSIFAAYFDNSIDADIAVLKTGTAYNGATISDCRLDLSGGIQKYVHWDVTGSLTTMTSRGTIRFLFTPLYDISTIPTVGQLLFTVKNADISSRNMIYILHRQFDGALFLMFCNASGSVVYGDSLGVWSPIIGREYEFCFCYYCDLMNSTKLFIDGTQFGPTINTSGAVRGGNMGDLWIGQRSSLDCYSNSYFRHFSMYPLALFASNYAPGNYPYTAGTFIGSISTKGLTSTSAIHILSAEPSINLTSGALTVVGGIGVKQRVWATNMSCATAPAADTDVVRRVDITGGVVVDDTPQFTRVGIGINPDPLTTLLTISSNGATGSQIDLIDTSAGPTTASIRNNASTLTFAVPLTVAGKGYTFDGDADAGIVTVSCSKPATDASTAALVVVGGAAVAGDIHVGGTVQIHGSDPIILDNNSGQLIISPTGTATGDVKVMSTTASTSPITGAITSVGGIGTDGDIVTSKILRPAFNLGSTSTFVLSYSKSVYPDAYIEPVITTPTAPYAITNERLVLTNGKCTYLGRNNLLACATAATFRFRYTPNYVSPTDQIIFSVGKNMLSTKNFIQIAHSDPVQMLYCSVYDSIGPTVQVQINFSWPSVIGQEYEFEFSYDTAAGTGYLFIDGVMHTYVGPAFTRTNDIDGLCIGDTIVGPPYAGNSNFSIRDFAVFPTVLHTSGYAPGYSSLGLSTNAHINIGSIQANQINLQQDLTVAKKINIGPASGTQNLIYVASFAKTISADMAIDPRIVSGGSPTPSIVNGALDLTGGTIRAVVFSKTNLQSMTLQGTIRFTFIPNYTSPGTPQTLFEIPSGPNRLWILHAADQTFGFFLYNSMNEWITQIFSSPTTVVLGREYELEADYNCLTGAIRLFLDGVLCASGSIANSIRTSPAQDCFIGSQTNTSNFSIRKLMIFSTEQHTTNYVPQFYSSVCIDSTGVQTVGGLYTPNTINSSILTCTDKAWIAANNSLTNAIFGASFSKVFHAEIAAINGATIADTPLISANGYLDLQGATGPKYVGFSGTNISTLANMGTIRLRYIPHVASLPPATQQVLFSTGATLLNAIYVAHINNGGTGRLIVSINSSLGVGGGTVSVSPAWTPTLGLEYEIEVDFQVSSPGFLYLFVNGALLASNTGTTFTRTGVVNGLYIGAPEHNLSSPGYYPDFLERDVVVWPTVQHIAAYTPTNYSVTSVTTGAISASGIYSQGIVANSMSCNNAATRPFDVLRVNDFITYAVIDGYWSATSGLPNSPMTFHLLKIGNLVMLTSTDKSTTVETTEKSLALISYSVTSGSLVGMLPQGTSLRTVKYVTLDTTMSEVNMGFGDSGNHPVISFTFQLAKKVNFSVGRISESWVL